MAAGGTIHLLVANPADIATPSAGHIAIFANSLDSNRPYFRDDAGVLHPLEGAAGPAGSVGPPGIPEEADFEPVMVPGPQGIAGPLGPTGPAGIGPLVMYAEDIEDPISIPGPKGADGVGSSGKVVQVVNTQTGAVASGTTGIPVDDTIPQNTEGVEYMTLSITPTNSSNKLRIDVVLFATSLNSGVWLIVGLFQDSTADAIAVGATFNYNVATAGQNVAFTHYMTAGTTSATTFKVRAGTHNGTSLTINGQSGGRLWGGVVASSITITEIVP